MINEKTHAAQKCPLCKHDYCPGYTELAVTQLAADLVRERPELRVLFMSGYTGDEFHSAEFAQVSRQLLVKPFTADVLLSRVRQTLDQH